MAADPKTLLERAGRTPERDLDLDLIWHRGLRRRRLTQVGTAVAAGLVLLAAGVTVTGANLPGVTIDPMGREVLPAEVVPQPGDELSDAGVIDLPNVLRADEVDLAELAVGGLAIGFDCGTDGTFGPGGTPGALPETAAYVGFGPDLTTTEVAGPVVCDPIILDDGRLVERFATDRGTPAIRDGGDPTAATPSAIDDDGRILGPVSGRSELLVSFGGADIGFAGGRGLVAVDVDSGDRRVLIELGELGEQVEILSAHATAETVVVAVNDAATAEVSLWVATGDEPFTRLRTIGSGFGDDVEEAFAMGGRSIEFLRIVEGPDGPLVASVEREPLDSATDLVLTALDGSSRVVGRITEGRDGPRLGGPDLPEDPADITLGGTVGSFTAHGDQLWVSFVRSGGSFEDGTTFGGEAVGLVLDLDTGTWSRLPFEAAVLGVTPDR